jgi:hypothetical protein
MGLPYWDWTSDNSKSSTIWQKNFMGGTGRSGDAQVMDGPFAYNTGQWTITVRDNDANYLRRELGTHIATLPSVEDVTAALEARPYDVAPWNYESGTGFRNTVEGFIPPPGNGMHNRVHEWVGGTMRPLPSPNDPIFFLHHCYIDKLWADWQVRQLELGGGNYDVYLPISGTRSVNLDDAMPPWNGPNDTVTPRDMLYTHRLGYLYLTDNDMQPSDSLLPGEQIKSSGGANANYLVYEDRGNNRGSLVLYRESPGAKLWESGERALGECAFEDNGNLVIRDSKGNTVWESETRGPIPDGHLAYRLVVQDLSPGLCIYNPDGTMRWSKP